ncbi:calcium-binding protein, partial [Sedimentitalea todarodis]
MTLQLVGRIATGDALLDGDLRDIDIVTTEAGSLLFATTGQSGGVSAWTLSQTGTLARLADSTYFSVWGMGIGSFDAVDVDGQTQLILSGTGAGKLIRYRIADDGALSKAGKIDLPGPTTQTHDALTTVTLTGGRTALYTVDADTGDLAGWLSSGNGALDSEIGFAAPMATLDPDSPVLLNQTEAGGVRFLLTADNSGSGVRSYRINADTGQLTQRDSCGIADGLGLALPTALETVTAHGATWVVLAAAGSNSLSVMQLAADGTLIPTDHILDTRATRFDGVTALEVVEADGHVFVLAGGADDGLSLFYLLPEGQLVHMQTLIHDTGLGLANVTGLTAVRIGDALQVFVSSGTEGGLSQFTLPLGALGTVIKASGTEQDVPLSGTEGSDLLLGSAGQTTLRGQAGNDILVSDASGGILTGGAGADIFVLHPTGNTLVITDFEPGSDQLDLTRFPMLRSLDQLILTPSDTGLILRFGETLIDIRSRDGKPLSVQDIWPGGLATPDRIQLSVPQTQGTSGADTLIGSAFDDTIHGGGGRDRIRGGDGADTLHGDRGNDRIKGGAGDDILHGGIHSDTLHGGRGNDQVWGGMGRDKVYLGNGDDVFRDSKQGGATGADLVRGGNGKDRIHGGGGNDTFHGESGKDMIKGGAGDDTLSGGIHSDTLHGGGGNDQVWGGMGRDKIYLGKGDDVFHDSKQGGGGGADLVKGGSGNDRIHGGGGNDTFYGELGDDLIKGGAGADRISGGLHSDTLYGGDGNDQVWGGMGRDKIYLGKGDDIFHDEDQGGANGADLVKGGSG